MIIIFGIVIFLAFIMESYVAVSEWDEWTLEEANSSIAINKSDF